MPPPFGIGIGFPFEIGNSGVPSVGPPPVTENLLDEDSIDLLDEDDVNLFEE